eukprot:937479-Rhodomonas_salina.1
MQSSPAPGSTIRRRSVPDIARPGSSTRYFSAGHRVASALGLCQYHSKRRELCQYRTSHSKRLGSYVSTGHRIASAQEATSRDVRKTVLRSPHLAGAPSQYRTSHRESVG